MQTAQNKPAIPIGSRRAAFVGPVGNVDRRVRFVWFGISSGVTARVNDPEYLKLLQEFRFTGG